jgi:hypothetical protein
MSEHDDRVSRRYRELPREEPPASIDAAIRARAHRAASPPRSRWVGAVSIAAVLVLALGITLRMQHEAPGIETTEPAKIAPREESAPAPPAPASAPPPREATQAAPANIPKPAPSRPAEERRAKPAAPVEQRNLSAPSAQKRSAAAQELATDGERDAQLERIAALREGGRAAEADEALARFRERFPDYRIPDALWQRVRPR